MANAEPKVLLTGATGFVGARLLSALVARGIPTRCLVRKPLRFSERLPDGSEVEMAQGDLLRKETLEPAMEGVDVAYYLVHSMGGRNIFQYRTYLEHDKDAATNFIKAADAAGVKRIIYMGGLGELADNLSEHLRSRQIVGRILQSGRARTTVLRAANIIGAGGAPFEMLRYLVERLPVMLCPRWIDTRCQPIAVQNAVDYLVGCLHQPATAGDTFDIGGPDIITYRELMRIYARVRGLHRVIVATPFLNPELSSMWISLITPISAGLVMPLVEGLKNEVICRDNRIRELIPIELISMNQAICNALAEADRGPGKLESADACYL